MISGLGDDELEWVMKESGSRFMTELDYDFWTDLDKAITDESATHSYDENLREIDEILTKEMDEAELNNTLVYQRERKQSRTEPWSSSKTFLVITILARISKKCQFHTLLIICAFLF